MIILGLDEAGRGPVMGPMIIAGVEISKEKEQYLRKIGVRDSKLLSRSSLERLYDEIYKVADNIFIEKISADKLNLLMKHKSLNVIELDHYVKIINSSNAEEVYVDAFYSNTRTLIDLLKARISREVKLYVEHKADSKYVVVAAASIIAKTLRERAIDELKEKYGDFGSGYPSDPKTQEFLKKYYREKGTFPKDTRLHWDTVDKIKSKSKQKSLF